MSQVRASESVILCEGYHDRAFWAGWLTSKGCVDPGLKPGAWVRTPVLDPWNQRVSAGQFAYHSPGGRFLRVQPCNGKSNILRTARLRLANRANEAIDHLLINMDSDLPAGSDTSTLNVQSIEQMVKQLDPNATRNDTASFLLDAGATEVAVVHWTADDVAAPGMPVQQTLERLVCSALLAAYPHRGPLVQNWLDSRPDAPPIDPKEHAWSYMAGWYASQGCEAFYSLLWSDPTVAPELEKRLRSSGAWAIFERLVS